MNLLTRGQILPKARLRASVTADHETTTPAIPEPCRGLCRPIRDIGNLKTEAVGPPLALSSLNENGSPRDRRSGARLSE